jgi:DNA-binding transcriptional ArsR family regulator
MVGLLSKEDLSVGSLTDAVGADVSTISKHLSLLKQVGILIDRKEGNRVLYSLICPCIMEFIHCIDDVIYQKAENGLSCVLPKKKLLKGNPDTPWVRQYEVTPCLQNYGLAYTKVNIPTYMDVHKETIACDR